MSLCPRPRRGLRRSPCRSPWMVCRASRADVAEKRASHVQRAHKELASARAPSVRAETVDATPTRVDAAPATALSSTERAPQAEVAAAAERKPIAAAERARPEPEPQVQAPDDLIEMQQVAKAEQLLARSPERALALVQKGDQRFAHGYFQQERAYITIMALIRLGRTDE